MALTILFNTGLNFSEGKLISSLPFQNTLIHDKLSKNNQGIELLTSHNCKWRHYTHSPVKDQPRRLHSRLECIRIKATTSYMETKTKKENIISISFYLNCDETYKVAKTSRITESRKVAYLVMQLEEEFEFYFN